jgi:hypothetical protein
LHETLLIDPAALCRFSGSLHAGRIDDVIAATKPKEEKEAKDAKEEKEE